MIHIRQTDHSTLPWRLFADETDGRCLHIPYASCSTKALAEQLKSRLEGVADWERRGAWSAAVRFAVLDVLGTTEASRIQTEAFNRR